MKRSLDQITGQGSQNGRTYAETAIAEGALYDASAKKRKLENQRVGKFIVKTNDAINFKVANDNDQKNQFFGPTFTH